MAFNDKPSSKIFSVKRILQGVAGILIFTAALFLSAGRFDWTMGWVYLSLWIFTITLVILLARKNPGLIRERIRRGPNIKRWDKVLINILFL